MKKAVKALSIILAAIIFSSVLSATPVFVNAAGGTTGSCSWYLDTNGKLTVSGNGSMGNYESLSEVPWSGKRSEINTVEIETGVTSIGDYCFYSCSNLKSIEIANTVKTIGKYAFCNCPALKIVSLPYGVTDIYDSAFQSCTSMTRVAFPSTLKNIGEWAFYHCESLTAVDLPYGITNVGRSAFNGCYSLTSLKFPDSVTSLGVAVFFDCYGLKSAVLPKKVTTLGRHFFAHCKVLESVTIPRGMNAFARRAFYKCPKLKDVYFKGSKTEWNKIDFGEDNQSVTKATVHYAIKSAKKAQSITAKSVTKTYGAKAFNLNAKAKTKLTYSSSNKKVATVSSTGKVTIKSCGKATITIKAKATSKYKASTKKIKITVMLAQVRIKSCYQQLSEIARVNISTVKGAAGYQFEVVKSGQPHNNNTPAKKGTFSVKVSSTGKWKIRLRAFGTFGGKTHYGKWSPYKSFKITY